MALTRFPWMTLGRRETSEEFFGKCQDQRARVELLSFRPRISIIIPILNGNSFGLEQTRFSLDLQSYQNLEVCVAQGQDWEEAFSRGLSQCTGEWIGVISPGDILSPAALFLMVSHLNKKRSTLLYTFEAEVNEELTAVKKLFRKSLLTVFDLQHFNSAGRFWLLKREKARPLLERELMLSVLQSGEPIDLIPYYLYYRRSPIALESVPVYWPELKSSPLVSVIVCFRDKPVETVQCLETLKSQVDRCSVEVVLVNNESSEQSKNKIKAAIEKSGLSYQWVDYSKPFNFGHMNNLAVREHSRGQYLFFLNNDVYFPKTENIIDKMVSWAQFSWIGTVGLLLRYPHGGIQHAGLGARAGGQARLVRLGNLQREDVFATQNHAVFGNTFAACLVSREIFDQVSGLPEIELANGFGDVAFNFECLRKGRTNVYLGTIGGVHAESASRGLSYEYWEELSIEREYPEIIQPMLRYDIAMQEVESLGTDVRAAVKEAVYSTIRAKLPWLVPIKSHARRLLRSVSLSS